MKKFGKDRIKDPETGELITVDLDDESTGIRLTYDEFMKRNSNQKVFSRSDFDEDEEEDWIKYKERMGLKW